MLDAVRLGPADDATAVTATQLRDVVDRLITAGQWKPGDPNIVIVADTGYDITRLAHVLADLPVELVGRLRSDRVLRLPKPPRLPGTTGRPPKHGPEIALDKPAHLADPAAHDQHRHHPLRHRGRHQLGPGPSPADPPRLLDRPRGRAARHRGHPDPAAGRAPARRPRTRNRSGCGPPSPAPPRPMWTAGGRPSCAVSTSNTPSGCSSRPSAGPPRRSATPTRPTAGPGCSSPPTPNYAWPDRWSPTCADPGRDPPRRAGSPRPGSAAAFGTSARPPCSPPAHPNPADPAPDAHPAPATDTPRPATTSAKRSNATGPSPHDKSVQVKDQAQGVSGKSARIDGSPCAPKPPACWVSTLDGLPPSSAPGGPLGGNGDRRCWDGWCCCCRRFARRDIGSHPTATRRAVPWLSTGSLVPVVL